MANMTDINVSTIPNTVTTLDAITPTGGRNKDVIVINAPNMNKTIIHISNLVDFFIVLYVSYYYVVYMSVE